MIGILGSLVGVYYYFRLIINMYFRAPAETDGPIDLPGSHRLLLITCVVLLIVLGLFPDLLLGVEIV